MRYLKIKVGLLVAISALALFSSCKKGWLDINDNPNNPTDENITPELIFNRAAVGSAARMASGNFRFLNSWLGYFSAAGDFAIVQDETTYNIDFSFSNAIWGNHYDLLFDLQKAKEKSIAKGDSVMAGACMVLSAKAWQELVDVFGNIPYKEAFKNNETRTPAYDNAKSIYDDLQKVLDTAKIYLAKTPKLNFNTYIGGIVKINNDPLGGQPTNIPAKIQHWIEFANTLKLRMLIHQAQVPGFNPAPEIAKISTSGVLNILREGESVNVQPGFVNEDNKQSFFYQNYGFTPTGADANTSTRANNYIVNILKGNNDARLTRFFAPTSGGTVVGTTFGAATGNPGGSSSSKFGPGLMASATQDAWIFPSFESLFLEAEAVARNWVTGDKRTTYENAVRESFRWLNILPDSSQHSKDSAIQAYLDDVPAANFDNAPAAVNDLVKWIAFQKYIALTGIDPIEAWVDVRRLNMLPAGYITVNPGRISNVLPARLLYPQSEYTTNSANVNAQGTINQFSSKIFWQP